MDAKDAQIVALTSRISALEAENSRLIQQLSHARSALLRSGGIEIEDSRTVIENTRKLQLDKPNNNKNIEGKSEDGTTIVCENCDRNIPTHTLSMHLIHCKRNTIKCSYCDAKVTNRELDIHIESSRGTALQFYSWAALGNLSLLSNALKHGAKEREGSLESALHVAARNRQCEISKLLISHGWKINSINANGETPLHLACGSRLVEGITDETKNNSVQDIVLFLLSKGADIDVTTGLGDSCIQVAQRAKNLDILSLISAAGGTLRPSSREPNAPKSRPSSARLLAPL
jgi:hypothetical protein